MSLLPPEPEKSQRLARAAEKAHKYKPRLFGLYGVRSKWDGRDILGWGMEFQEHNDALVYLPMDLAFHHTRSAEQALRRYSMLGEVHLIWLDGE